jgi:hypothetical protein
MYPANSGRVYQGVGRLVHDRLALERGVWSTRGGGVERSGAIRSHSSFVKSLG